MYRAMVVRYPMKKKQAQKSFAILALQVSRDMKSIVAGPLSVQEGKNSLKIKFLGRVFLEHQGPRLRDMIPDIPDQAWEVPIKKLMQGAFFLLF